MHFLDIIKLVAIKKGIYFCTTCILTEHLLDILITSENINYKYSSHAFELNRWKQLSITC